MSYFLPPFIKITVRGGQNVSVSFYGTTACYATHGIAKAFLSVCLSVHLSNTCIVMKRKKLVPRFLYYTPSTWNFGPNLTCWGKNVDFQAIFAHSTSAVTPSEMSSN